VSDAYIVIACGAALAGMVWSVMQIMKAVRKRWIEDEEHSRVQRENTRALRDLTKKLDSVGKTLDAHDRKLDDHDRRLVSGGL
jgi:hypothetical protein